MTSPFDGPGSVPPPPRSTTIPPPPFIPPPPPPPPAPLPPEPIMPAGYQHYSPLPPGISAQRSGFGRRLGAYLLDGLLYGLLGLALMIPGLALLISGGLGRLDQCTTIGNETFCPDGTFNGGQLAIGGLLLVIAYLSVVVVYIRSLGRTGQTWGRKIVGIKVIDSRTGQPIGSARAFGRQLFGYYISAGVFYLGFLWMLWDSKNETWHDKVVNSAVIDV